MKFLVYGHKGWIGQQVVNLLAGKYQVIYGAARLDDEKSVEEEILKSRPDRIISLTGRTHGPEINNVDYLELPGKLAENVKDNLFGPLILALICKKLNIHLTYLGTGCIFHSEDNESTEANVDFDENGKPNFFGSSYSTVKGFTDRIMHQFEENVLNVRIRMCLTEDKNKRNFITKLTTYEYICSIPNSMTVLPELLPIMIDMCKKKVTGTINLTNPGAITHNEILTMYKEIVDPSFTWKNFTLEQQNKILRSARSSNILNTKKLESLYPHVTPIKEAVRRCLVRMTEIDYKPTSVLLTGGCGFIGSNTLNYLANKYAGEMEFVNIDKIAYCANEKNVQINNPKVKYTFYKGDINDLQLVRDILTKHNIDTVIHLAAQTHVDNSFGNSIHFTEDNILGTHTLLEACNEYKKIKRFLHISTDEVYGEINDDHLGCYEESSVLNPTNPYAATKASAEFLVRSYMHSFKFPVVMTRGNNVYGPLQFPEKLIPKFTLQLINDNKCTVHGQGNSRRNYIYIDDTVKAIETILLKGKLGEIYNIGTMNEFTVNEIVSELVTILKPGDKPEDWVTSVKDRAFNDYRYYINSSKLHNLGWVEQTPFGEGLKKTVEWFKSNPNYFDLTKVPDIKLTPSKN
jgi:dTDP-glucose 4,6-dehydratase